MSQAADHLNVPVAGETCSLFGSGLSTETYYARVRLLALVTAGRNSLAVDGGITGMMGNAFVNVKNRSRSITVEREIPAVGVEFPRPRRKERDR
jgi:hypothetical protein